RAARPLARQVALGQRSAAALGAGVRRCPGVAAEIDPRRNAAVERDRGKHQEHQRPDHEQRRVRPETAQCRCVAGDRMMRRHGFVSLGRTLAPRRRGTCEPDHTVAEVGRRLSRGGDRARNLPRRPGHASRQRGTCSGGEVMAVGIEERSRAAETHERAPRRIAGVWCPVLTPVDQDLNPDAPRFVAHARWLLDEGCHGLVVFGTTGEANSFSVDERIALLEAAVEAGLPRERLVVGTGCCALTDTVRLTRHALSLGITGVLALPPFYYKNNSDEALFNS